MATAAHGEEDATIEVTNCSSSIETLNLYFENKKRSGGGDVTNITEKGNRFFITFEDQTVANRVVGRSHVLEGHKLKVKLCERREIDNTRLLVKNISVNTTEDCLELFLKDKAGCDVLYIDKDENKRKAIVTFEDEIDVKRVVEKFNRQPDKKKKLDGSKLQLFSLNETSTVEITDLPDNVTPDWLELYFENKKRSGGGDVESVTINPDKGSAKVTFSNSSDVASVLNRTHEFSGVEFSASAYYGSVDDDSEESSVDEDNDDMEAEEKPQVKPKSFRNGAAPKARQKKQPSAKEGYKPEYSLPVDSELIQFIEADSERRNEFSGVMADANATVVRHFGGDNIRVSASQSIGGKGKHQEWEENSQATLAGYLSKYSRKTVSVVPQLWQTVLNDLEETPQQILKMRKDDAKHEIQLLGKTSDVEKATAKVQQITTAHLEKMERESRKQTSKISHQNKSRLYMLRSQLDNIRAKHREVEISIDWESNSVVFTGCQEDLSLPMCDVYETFNGFQEKRYSPSKSIGAFLKGKAGKSRLYRSIKDKNVEAGVEVVDSEIIINAKSPNTIKVIIGIIENDFKADEIRNKSDVSAVFEKDEFKSLVANLQRNSLVKIDLDDNAVVIAGFKPDVESAKKKLHEYIQANMKTSAFLKVDENIMRYLKSHKSESEIDNIKRKLYQSKGTIKLQPSGISLEGNPEAIGDAKRQLEQIVSRVKKRDLRYNDTGHCKFFIEGKGKHLAKSIESTVPCAIKVNTKGRFDERKEDHGLFSSKAIKIPSLSSKNNTLNKHGTRFVVKQGDIASEQVDVIVNSVSSDIESPFRGGISKAILAKAGDRLLQETQGLGALNVGEVKSTGSGKLKCKRVYHCVLDKWNGGQGKKILSSVFMSALYKANKGNFTSIAFPSLGTGFLRFPHNQAAEIMFREALTFARKNPNASLKDIRFIVFDSESVDAFNRELASHMDSGSHVQSHISYKEEKHAKFGNVSLDIRGGDLTKEGVDAIVNPVAPNLEQGQVGRAIIKAAGSRIEDEYDDQKNNLQYGPIVTGGGNLRHANTVVHMICPSAVDLADAVESCLTLGENYNFNSIALPAIGTGYYGLSVDESAGGIIEGVKRFSRCSPRSLTSVKIVIFQDSMVTDYARKLGQVLGNRPVQGNSQRNRGHGGGFQSPQYHGKPEVTISIFADNDRDLSQAEEEVKKLLEEEVIEDKIDNDLVSQLDDCDLKRVQAIGSHNNVTVTLDKKGILGFFGFGSARKALHLRGLKIDVEKYKTQINTWLEKYSWAAEMKKTVKWFYHDGQQKREFDTMWNYDLETARMAGEKAIYLMAEDLSPAYRVDFETMKETDLRRHRTFKLERKAPDDSGIRFPEKWDKFPTKHDPQEPHLVALNKGSQEYKLVENGFLTKSDGINPTVMQIERIQHKLQYQIYSLRKRAMDQKYPNGRCSGGKRCILRCAIRIFNETVLLSAR
ncbi:protein mono-ADP-ribosyltransferase PARP14-like isoform X2 [Ptychodera flava]|uniref:protein mono-ADP-ribosyltransferase PARP14-like isoform X2 n=1 Tax=Ptychodera flava TaxID=63121 RepID=UPI00396A26D2